MLPPQPLTELDLVFAAGLTGHKMPAVATAAIASLVDTADVLVDSNCESAAAKLIAKRVQSLSDLEALPAMLGITDVPPLALAVCASPDPGGTIIKALLLAKVIDDKKDGKKAK